MINKKQQTITSKDFQRVFWFNHNQDFVCNSIDSFNENKKKGLEFEIYEYVEEWIASSNSYPSLDSPRDIEKVFEIFRQLVIVSMGGFSTDLDSYRNKKAKT